MIFLVQARAYGTYSINVKACFGRKSSVFGSASSKKKNL